jgi:hypothetical protein
MGFFLNRHRRPAWSFTGLNRRSKCRCFILKSEWESHTKVNPLQFKYSTVHLPGTLIKLRATPGLML